MAQIEPITITFKTMAKSMKEVERAFIDMQRIIGRDFKQVADKMVVKFEPEGRKRVHSGGIVGPVWHAGDIIE